MKLASIHLRRYRDIALLLWKYGRSDLVKQIGIDEALDPEAPKPASGGEAAPDQLADDLEAMGPTYVKLGQVLSSRSDLLPEPYLKALARLQDKVKPFPFSEVEEIVTAELGVRISKVFASFNPHPIASASLGQVYSATMRDGRCVVVKVQRPNIRKQIAADFEVLDQIAEFVDAHTELGRRYRFLNILKEFRTAIQQELNYDREAQHLIALGANLEDFKLIQVPQPLLDYCSRCVLTMNFVKGRKITSARPLRRLVENGAALAEELFRAYLKQVLVDGMFHADPHPGNVLLTDDGRIALLDLGMVGYMTPGMQENLLKLLLAISEGNSDSAADIMIGISEKTARYNQVEFRRRNGQLMASRRDQDLQQVTAGKVLLEVTKNAADNGLFVPSELAMLGKTLMQLDEVGKLLDPAFDPNASIRRNAVELMTQHLRKTATQGNIFRAVLETKDFVNRLPSRLNRIMDAITDQELEIKVKALDAPMVVAGIQKIANRITTGILLAALIIGAALMMRIQTSFELLGYPGLAILCFLAAAAGGFWLVVSIIVQDHKGRKK